MVPYHRPIPESKTRGRTSGGIFNVWIQAEKMMQIALVLPCATVIGWLAGLGLDRHFHQAWISVVGVVFGGASGLVYAIRLALAADKDPAMQDDPANDSGKGTKGTGS